jgi:hypothetical protein
MHGKERKARRNAQTIKYEKIQIISGIRRPKRYAGWDI